MKIVKIKAYKYEELNEKARDKFINEMYDWPFDYDYEDENGEIIRKYDFFGQWELSEQIEYCEMNEYLFDKYGGTIGHLIIEERSQK